MEHKLLLRVAGPVWELARLALFIAYLSAASSQAGRPDMLSAPWLVGAAAGGLVMPAAFAMIAFSPARYAGYLPLLRLGKGLQLAALALLFATGTVASGSAVPVDVARLPVLLQRAPVLYSAPVAFGAVALLDLLVLAGLLRVKAEPAGVP